MMNDQAPISQVSQVIGIKYALRSIYVYKRNIMSFLIKSIMFLLAAATAGCGAVSSSAEPADLRAIAPMHDAAQPVSKDLQTAVFAGGCFWGVEAVFEHVKGVTDVRSGYAGGDAAGASYDKVSGGSTDHAEAVKITFDPARVTYVQLLTVFFSVAHDPTQLNRQGPDTGSQYRSVIFYMNAEQKKFAMDYIAAIDKAKALPKPIVTQVAPLDRFFEAEASHQDYLANHRDQPYIVLHDLPKLEDLKTRFPELYVQK